MSSTHRRRRLDKEKRVKHDTEEGGDHSKPRTYGNPIDPFSTPEEQFENLRLQVQNHDQDSYDGDQTAPSIERGEEYSGKGKERQDAYVEYEDSPETWSEWSEYIWSPEQNCWYTERTNNSTGKKDYHYVEQEQSPHQSLEDSQVQSQQNSAYDYTATEAHSYPDSYDPEYTHQSHGSEHPVYDPESTDNASSSRTHRGRRTKHHHSSAREDSIATARQVYGEGQIYDVPDSFDPSRRPTYSPRVPSPDHEPLGTPGQLPPIYIENPINECDCDTGQELCGVLVIHVPGSSKPKDGKVTEEKASSSRRSTHSSKHKPSSRSSGNKAHAQGPDGKNCGPLSLPGITPGPMPEQPEERASRREWKDYDKKLEEWKKNFETWKNITCPCGFGYFNRDGLWISGQRVQAKEAPINPLWKKNGGKAPDTDRKEKFKGILTERDLE